MNKIIENSKKNIVGDANNIRKIARFEMTNYFRITGDYGLSIYYSLQLLEEHPDNYFLAMNVLKSLYMLSKYKESNSIEKFMSKPESDSNGYKQVYTFLSRLTTSGYKRLTYAYAKSLNEKFKEKDNYFFYMCLAMEAYVGKDAARLYFAQYLTKFPNGDNTPFVKYKLNQ